MKVELELNVDGKGNPIIKIRHHDKNNSMEQNLLKLFIHNANCARMSFKKTTGYLETGTNNSWENYEIVAYNEGFK